MESATTNLSEVTADFVRLWDGGMHREVREMFVNRQSVVAPEAVEVQVGQEIDTELVYPTPTDEQVPSLKGLLAYIDGRGTGGVVNKTYTTKRRHYTLNEGAVQQVQQHKTQHTRKHYTLNEGAVQQVQQHKTQHTRKHYTLNEGAVQQVKQHKALHTHRHAELHTADHHSYQKTIRTVNRTNLSVLEVYSPVFLVKQIRNVRVTRPVYIFAS
jgi:hypothetical protein